MKDKLPEIKAALIEPASMLFAVQKVYGDQIREKTVAAYGGMLDAHLLLSGVIGAALLRVNGKIAKISDTGEERAGLLASFVIGLESFEDANAEGRYLQALALLRQEMETIAQLIAVERGQRKEGRAPNVAVLDSSVSRLYGELSEAAHLSRRHLVRGMTAFDMETTETPGPTSGTRYFPVFEKDLARQSFGIHLYLMMQIIEQMRQDHDNHAAEDQFGDSDREAVDLAVELLRSEGVVEVAGATEEAKADRT